LRSTNSRNAVLIRAERSPHTADSPHDLVALAHSIQSCTKFGRQLKTGRTTLATEHQDGFDPPPEAPDGLGGRLTAQVRAHIRPVLLVVIPALLITALSPAGEGLRELLFPTRVSVTGTLALPEGNFPNLAAVLDDETRVPTPSGTFEFEGVSKGNHVIAMEGSGLSRKAVPFTVGSRSDDIDLGEVRVEPAIRVVGHVSLLDTSLGVDAVLWIEGSRAALRDIKSVQYVTQSLAAAAPETTPIRGEAFCTHYVLEGISAAGWTPIARANYSGGGYVVVRFESPSTPEPSCSLIVTISAGNSGGFNNPGGTGPAGGGNGNQSATVPVPNLIGLTKELAIQALEGWGLLADVVNQPSDQSIDTVVAQDPSAGTEVERGSTVTITISEGEEMPNVVGMTALNAKAQLTQLGLEVAVELTDCGQNQGTVCQQDPEPGSSVTAGETATLTIQK
jgi:hypothetical protein